MDWTIENINNQYIVVRTFGKYDFSDHHKMIEGLLSQDYWRSGTPIIYDHRELDISEASYETVQNAAIVRTKYEAQIGNSRAAIVAGTDYVFGVFRQFEAFVERDITGSYRVFKSYEDAEIWIKEGLP